MIKPEELMIGNKVKSTGLLNGRILTVENITGRGSLLDQKRVVFFLEEKNVGDFCEDLEPIPLTEELLVKAGFEKIAGSYNKDIDSFGGGKRLCFSGDYLYIIDSETQNTIPTDIITLWNKDLMNEFYLHRLQNLYFALTGTELTIKL